MTVTIPTIPLTTALTIGTRTSALALWQTEHIMALLQTAWPGVTCHLQRFVTQGDKTLDKPLPVIGGKGLFTAELERALLAKEIDIAVHSLKDLPVTEYLATDGLTVTDVVDGLTLGAITSRADVRDALVARNGWTLATLPPGAIVGTSSTRRAAQLQALRPDLTIRSIRGNVDTRLRKVLHGDYDATLLALAGLERLGLTDAITERLALSIMLPAPGQGALAVQCRADDATTLALLAAIDDAAVRAAVTAERAFLHGLGGGCSAPVAAYAQVVTHVGQCSLQLEGLIAAADGQQIIRVTGESQLALPGDRGRRQAFRLGNQLAAEALQQGAAALVAQRAAFAPPLVATPTLPLQGKRVVVTRPAEQSVGLLEKLTTLGATPILMPTIQIEPLADLNALDAALLTFDRYDWLILTSANSVTIVGNRLIALGLADQVATQLPIAVVGPVTATALATYGLTPALVPPQFEASAIVTALQATVGNLQGLRILLPQAAIARQAFAAALTAQGALVDVIPIYQTLPAPLSSAALAELQQGVDVITLTSGSTAQNLVQGLTAANLSPTLLDSATIACIGPQSAATAQALGLQVDVVATDYTIDGLVDALVAHLRAMHRQKE
ncbi:MAG: hydroxymethylbilane synthase [Caldilineaceae bacterium]|nr:hydroxymethylbilane synthase [Caldilineaceae bacterium]